MKGFMEQLDQDIEKKRAYGFEDAATRKVKADAKDLYQAITGVIELSPGDNQYRRYVLDVSRYFSNIRS